jgi:4-amino-4-deoxy-L-arabinose transferase-like glycosyltransferase
MHKSNDPSFLQSTLRDRRFSFVGSRIASLRSLLPARLTRLTATTWTRPELYAWVGLIAITLGLRAQQLLNGPTPSIIDSARWYSLAIGVLIAGWWSSYTNQSLLAPSTDRSSRLGDLRLGIALRSVALNVVSLFLIFSSGPSVGVGVAAWFTSLGLLIYACRAREARLETPPATEITTAPWILPRKIEAFVFLAIMGVAVVMRLWRLGDLAPGMHGDEGEAGVAALNILNGNLVSPFERGWSTQSNVYYWTLAICMRVFGTGLAGLRSFAVLCGLATVVFVYFLARELFGQRCAFIAGTFLSFQTADLIFSRQQFSNDTVPMFLACVAYFLAHGIRTRRHINFAIAGIASGFALYYYAGGRLVAPTAILFLGYVTLTRRTFLVRYWTHLSTFVVGVVLTSGPFIAYNYFIAPIQGVGYPNDRFVWYHEAELAAQYGVSGWPAILWNQLTRTLSIITYNFDVSAMQVGQFSIARPLESVLIVLGVAWALFRWKDTRFALLSIWFWTSICIGGVLTNEAPDLPRILGILGVMPLLIAVVLDHLSGQFQLVVSSRQALKSMRWAGPAAGVALVLGATAVAGAANWQTYTGTYLNAAGNQIVSIQAQYVSNRGSSFFYYDLGAYFPQVATLYWGHGNNRFLNPVAGGEDVTDLATALPAVDNGPTGQQDVIFLVWTFSPQYKILLHTLRQYYPHGVEKVDHELLRPGQAPILVSYTVSHREIDASRGLQVRDTSPDGRAFVGFDRSAELGHLRVPVGAQYPVRATWEGSLVVPVTGQYVFRFSGPPGSSFSLDHQRIMEPSNVVTRTSTSLLLTRGPHTIRFSSTLPTPQSHLELLWNSPDALPGSPLQPVQRRYVWDGHPGN